MEIIKGDYLDILGKRKIAFFISAIFVIVGFVAVFAIPLGKANLGTDFSGGLSVQLRFEKPLEMDRMRDALKAGGFEDADLQEITGGNKLLVRLKRNKDVTGTGTAIGEVFRKAMPDNPFVVDSTTEVGPTVGKKLQEDALWAVLISLVGIFIYVAWRFQIRFGLAAVLATFHDVLAVLGILFILDREINLLIITALLTIAGYSLNDTVVVFDRIRENMRKGGKDSFEVLVNKSITEVLRRTVVTSVTTLLVLVVLLLIGGEVIHDFSLALFLGVLIGTYSSIFVASPLLLLWKGKGHGSGAGSKAKASAASVKVKALP
ncbi:Protein translocase subunit SecF [hydrothermal vent metagenome]|uniref:Protein translocase subunit SecF n=1 Tax=hydrothermal vent metagenome TaxID=652676 RepID=A0A3B0VJQ4_9ZZZZ